MGDDEIEPCCLVGLVACFVGADVSAGAGVQGVMLVEIAGAPVALRLLCVVLQELALETGQIVHQYNYYVPKSAQRRGS